MINNTIDIRPYRRANQYIKIGSMISRVWLAYKNSVTRRKAIRTLESLNDAQLYDIGIPRHSIKDVINSNLNRATNRVVEPTITNITPVEARAVPTDRLAA